MALIDKLMGNPPYEFNRIPTHPWSAAMFFWALGEVTRAQVITEFSLETSDEAQLDMIAAHYAGLSPNGKREFHGRIESAGILAEEGYITQQKYMDFLEIT